MSVARKYSTNGNLLDLINEGNKGLIEAAEKFDYRKQVKFISYAVWQIKQKIFKYLEEKVEPIRISMKRVNEKRNLEKLREGFPENFGYEPTYNEFADYASDYFGINLEKTKFLLDLPRVSCSLNAQIKNLYGDESIDLLEDDSKHFTTKLEERCVTEVIKKKLNELPKQIWIDVIKMRYGIFDEPFMDKYGFNENKINELRSRKRDGFSLQTIGDILGFSKERIRQIEEKAIIYMKETFADDSEISEFRY